MSTSRNSRQTVWVTINGQRKPMKEWSVESGIKYATLRSRVKKGWSEDRLLEPAGSCWWDDRLDLRPKGGYPNPKSEL